MNFKWSGLLASKNDLSPLPAAACLAYHRELATMVDDVNRALGDRPDLLELIGTDGVELMQDNHRNHAEFMDNVFFLGNFDLLARTIPWVYRVYVSRGFSTDYFPVALHSWQDAVRKRIPGHLAAPILATYQWLLDRHSLMCSLYPEKSEQELTPVSAGDPSLDILVKALVAGDRPEAERLSKQILGAAWDVEGFYLQVIEPVLRRIGRQWEHQQITTAQEHIASALVTRMMSEIYSGIKPSTRLERRVVVSAGPSERHQIGAWMVADLLELRGWDTRFLGADTPALDLLNLLESFKPHVLALSITMPFNLRQGADLITQVRKLPCGKRLRIMVGGGIFNHLPELVPAIRADGCARDAREACLLAESWQESSDL